ncbi:MAG TPA: LPS export ABC transporter periplasmic protein LptC [Rhodospirillaceae bacterium]|nr:LPS export ABC transporter periplasmic protein LptC [Rhodospirillaceae bacterium]
MDLDLRRHLPPRSRYSRFVDLMKVALPATAAALMGLLAAWPSLSSREGIFQTSFAKINLKTVDTLSMSRPRYFGTDDKNLPFTLTADIGTQTDPQNLVVALEKPVADLTSKDGGGIVINSDLGFFRQKDGTLDLLGHVDLYQDSGLEMHTESARIDVGPGDAIGDEPTQGQGPSGTIVGDGFRLWNRGKVIIFSGKAKAVLNMTKGKSKS